jgi:hypothetical protein
MMLHWLALLLRERIWNNVVFIWFHVLKNVHHVFVPVNYEFNFLGTSSNINHILTIVDVNLPLGAEPLRDQLLVTNEHYVVFCHHGYRLLNSKAASALTRKQFFMFNVIL